MGVFTGIAWLGRLLLTLLCECNWFYRRRQAGISCCTWRGSAPDRNRFPRFRQVTTHSTPCLELNLSNSFHGSKNKKTQTDSMAKLTSKSLFEVYFVLSPFSYGIQKPHSGIPLYAPGKRVTRAGGAKPGVPEVMKSQAERSGPFPFTRSRTMRRARWHGT